MLRCVILSTCLIAACLATLATTAFGQPPLKDGAGTRRLLPYNETLTWNGRTFQLYRVESALAKNRLDLRYLVKPKIGYPNDGPAYNPNGKLIRFDVDFELLPDEVTNAKAEALEPIAEGRVVTIQPELPIRATVSLEDSSRRGHVPLQLFSKAGELPMGGPIQIGPQPIVDKNWIDHLGDQVARDSTRIIVDLGFRFQTSRVATGFVRGATVLSYDRIEDVTGVDPTARPVLVDDVIYRRIGASEEASRYLDVEAKLGDGLSKEAAKTLMGFLENELAQTPPTFKFALELLRTEGGVYVFDVEGLQLEMEPTLIDDMIGDTYKNMAWRDKQIDSVKEILDKARKSGSNEEFTKDVRGSGGGSAFWGMHKGQGSVGYVDEKKSSQYEEIRDWLDKYKYKEAEEAGKLIESIHQELKRSGTKAKPVRLYSQQDRFLTDSRTLRIEEVLSSRTEVITASDPAFPLVPNNATTSPIGRIVRITVAFSRGIRGTDTGGSEADELNTQQEGEKHTKLTTYPTGHPLQGSYRLLIVLPLALPTDSAGFDTNDIKDNMYSIPFDEIGIADGERVSHIAAFASDLAYATEHIVRMRPVADNQKRVIKPNATAKEGAFRVTYDFLVFVK